MFTRARAAVQDARRGQRIIHPTPGPIANSVDDLELAMTALCSPEMWDGDKSLPRVPWDREVALNGPGRPLKVCVNAVPGSCIFSPVLFVGPQCRLLSIVSPGWRHALYVVCSVGDALHHVVRVVHFLFALSSGALPRRRTARRREIAHSSSVKSLAARTHEDMVDHKCFLSQRERHHVEMYIGPKTDRMLTYILLLS